MVSSKPDGDFKNIPLALTGEENLLQPALNAERRHSVLWLAPVQGQIVPFSAAVYRRRGGLCVHRYVKRALLMSCYPGEADRKSCSSDLGSVLRDMASAMTVIDHSY